MTSGVGIADLTDPRAEQRIDRFLSEARELYDATREICSRLELDDVLLALVRRTNRVLGGDVAYLAECDDEHRMMWMRAFDNVRSDAFKMLSFPYDAGVGGVIAAERRVMCVSDYHDLAEHRFHHTPEIDQAVDAEGLRAGAGAPVEFEGRVLAVLFVAKRTRHDFSEHQLTLLASLANAAAIAINNAQIHGQLVATMAMQESLMTVALDDRGPAAVAETLTNLIRGPVALLDWHGRCLAAAHYQEDELHIPSPERLHKLCDGSPREPGEPSRVIAIKLGGEVEGYLVAGRGQADDQIASAATQQASTVFALELAKIRSAEQTELRLRGGLLDELLAGTREAVPALVRHAQRLGCDLTRDHTIAVMRFRFADAVQPADPLMRRLTQTVSLSAGWHCKGSLVAERHNLVVVLIPDTDPASVQRSVELYVARCRQAALPDVVAGIGSFASCQEGYAQAYAEARQAVEAAARFERAGPVALFNELPFHQLVLNARPNAEIASLAMRFLAPLDDYDQRRRTQLVHTVGVFLECNGNTESSARKLNLHPNTLRQRLERIAKLLDCDLNSARTRLDLALALEVRALSLAQPRNADRS